MPMEIRFMENLSQADCEALQGYVNSGEANIRGFRGSSSCAKGVERRHRLGDVQSGQPKSLMREGDLQSGLRRPDRS
jgi:hypothetical protein